ncbi:LON peptidase N-terminal domain and RING finger protein 1 isoform X1 [Sphaerodactylus townsendi]|uniref:LON peptidase N-terminal domain and RING finger protein 1 isoform X1 n=1 Tax=Sphaerodactylus townsendi TaxID=933632 RepID=UPI002026F616|nr:LON peptidase N-terminal domain and RING finger protein 1 isoform X1 [Sphaerodactylus townsendi]
MASPPLAPEPGGDAPSEQERLLRRGELLALGNRLKEALEAYSAALRLGPPLVPTSRRRLGTLVDCLVLHYRLRLTDDSGGAPAGLFCCCGCRGFLGEPVVAPCGHAYCRRCLREGLRARCRLCGQALGASTVVAVVLGQLSEKWFPVECRRTRTWRRLGELLGQGRHRAAREAASQALGEDPRDLMLRIYRAESSAALQEFKFALDDLNAVITEIPSWPEVYFRRAKIFRSTGSVDDALQLFLHCLALDEGFLPAKLEVEKMLYALLSPENVGKHLKESALSSPHARSKHVSEMDLEPDLRVQQVTSEPVGENLSLGESTRSLISTEKIAKEDGLKRVSSEPLLSVQEKDVFLKRKLSLSEQDFTICEDRNKQTKEGETTEKGTAILLGCGAVPKDLIDVSDFECSLCMRLFFHPVTTPCGHTFCKNCLERCLDYAPQCPLCKECLKEYLASRKYSITHLLKALIKKYLPAELAERKRIHDEETAEHSSLTRSVPIFVCTMAYPTVPCPLHVFEPRYRLMIRRSIETGTKQFGMCTSDPQKGFADYGCMLYIRNIDYLPDGRSIVDTVGLKRFTVLQRGMKDGYCTADIEYLEDTKIKDEGETRKLGELHDFVYSQACSWFQSLRNKFHTQILQHFGPMPERESNVQDMANGPAWCWWLLAVLPVDPRYQLTVFSMRSLKERLIKIQDILTYFSRDQSK